MPKGFFHKHQRQFSLSQEKFEDIKGVIMNLIRGNTDNAMDKRKRTMSKITLREIFQLILQGG